MADQVVGDLFAAGKVDSVNALMRTLVQNDGIPADQLPPAVHDYLARSGQLPDWADAKKIEAGERVFWRYGPAVIAILHCYSLPFCYAGRKGVQVLALTSRLYTNPTRRIIETAQMVVDVMRPGGLGSVGTGICAAQKIRLIHAGLRFQIGSYAGWDRQKFDLPINQEDMAGTLLSFSYITLEGLRRLGYELTEEEREGYLHAWNVVGHVLGMQTEMLAGNYADAAVLADRIATRQFAACEEGQMMTRALLDMMRHEIPGNLLDDVPAILMRYLLGDRVAAMLGVSAAEVSELLIGPLRALTAVRSKLMHDCAELAHVHELFGRALIEGIVYVGRGGQRIPFTVPTELLQTWGVNGRP